MVEARRIRPRLLTAAITLQWLLALGFLAIVAYVLYLSRSPEMLKAKDPADAVHGLYVGAGFMALPAVGFVLAAIGLARGAVWGWIVALITNLGVVALFLEEPIFEHEPWISEDTAFAVPSIVAIVLLLLPPVLRYFFRTRRKAVAGGSAVV